MSSIMEGERGGGVMEVEPRRGVEWVHSDLVYVKSIRFKGRGVFARRAIPAGAVIEHVPAVLFPARLIVGGLTCPDMGRFFFIRNQTMFAVPLGFGCIYNHSFDPNADYFDADGATMLFMAIRDIAPDEEITINYNGDPQCQDMPSGFRPV